MNKPYWWWLLRPQYWSKLIQRNRLREAFGLRLISALSKAEQSIDDIAPTQKVVRVVRAIERGVDIEDAEAQQLWQLASADSSVQQLADNLRRISCAEFEAVSVKFTMRDMGKLRSDTTKSIQFESLSLTQHMPVLIPLVSAFFLFSGYIHTAIFFKDLNVVYTRYFGLSDYIAASMDGLISTILATGLAILMMLMARKMQRLNALQRQLLVNNWGSVFGVVMVIICLLAMRIPRSEMQTVIIYALIITIGTSVAPYIAAYAKRPNATLLLSSFIVLYSALIWLNAKTRLEAVTKKNAQTSKIVLNDDNETTLKQRVIAGNSLYLFLLDENDEVTVIPVENVKYVHHDKEAKTSKDSLAGDE